MTFRCCGCSVQEELQVVPGLLAMLDSPVAALRAKALVSFALLTQTHLALLLAAFQLKLSPQVYSHVLQQYVQSWTYQCGYALVQANPNHTYCCNA